jgi:hypothetical protein
MSAYRDRTITGILPAPVLIPRAAPTISGISLTQKPIVYPKGGVI